MALNNEVKESEGWTGLFNKIGGYAEKLKPAAEGIKSGIDSIQGLFGDSDEKTETPTKTKAEKTTVITQKPDMSWLKDYVDETNKPLINFAFVAGGIALILFLFKKW